MHFFAKKYLFITLLLLQSIDNQAIAAKFNFADSLYKKQEYAEAIQAYERILENQQVVHPIVYLKLANAQAKQENFAKSIYYLNKYYLYYPSEKVFDKIFLLAQEQNFEGYDRSDLNFFINIYQQYFVYLIAIFLIFGLYVLSVFWLKKKKKELIPTRHKWVLVLYLLFLIGLLNIPRLLSERIVRIEKAYVRQEPSAGSQVVKTLSQGNKITIVGTTDIWCRIFLDGRLHYIKESDLWIL
ncbi:MAG: SH3 domain-containing protein [Spirosomataceae bacterium]